MFPRDVYCFKEVLNGYEAVFLFSQAGFRSYEACRHFEKRKRGGVARAENHGWSEDGDGAPSVRTANGVFEFEFGFSVMCDGSVGVLLGAGMGSGRGGTACGLGGEYDDLAISRKRRENTQCPIDVDTLVFFATPCKKNLKW